GMLSVESPPTLAESFLRGLASSIDPDPAPSTAAMPWEDWVTTYFPRATSAPFAERHRRLWEWIDSLTPGVRPRARVESWPRGGGKSTSVELGVVRVGEKLSRRFALYVSATQDQADKHVQSVAARFEFLGRGRRVNKYGISQGWKVDLLRTDHGFNVMALGLD